MQFPRAVHYLTSKRHGIWVARGIEIGLVVQGDSFENVDRAMRDALNCYTNTMDALEFSGGPVDPIPPLRWSALWLIRWWIESAMIRLLSKRRTHKL